VQQTETIRHPTNKRQVLFGDQHRQANIAVQAHQ
jgi:hypothetical protein